MRTGGCGYRLRRGGSSDDEEEREEIQNEDEKRQDWVSINPSDDIIYLTPKQDPDVFFADHFDNQADFTKKWIKSQAKKEGVIDESIAKYDGEWSLEQSQKDPLNGDLGLVLKTKAKHAAIAAPLGKIYKFEDKPFVVQYELNFQVCN